MAEVNSPILLVLIYLISLSVVFFLLAEHTLEISKNTALVSLPIYLRRRIAFLRL
jgi:hypothetical protein